MLDNKTGLLHLAAIMKARGIRHIIVSPGSRNAPIITVFCKSNDFECLTIVDERSAAYFAIGMIQQLQKPVAIVCTSGTAVLNYAPAIAEAYYLQLPLIVLTADRPPEWIDQGDGQTIRQQYVFDRHIRKSVQLPHQILNTDDLWYNDRLIAETLNAAIYPVSGPVHINLPFAEPLYQFDQVLHTTPKDITCYKPEQRLNPKQLQQLASIVNSSRKKMVLVGQMTHYSRLQELLTELAHRAGFVILTETTSNHTLEIFHGCIDRSLSRMKNPTDYQPELLITIGGAIVSKRIKGFLRKSKIHSHWHIGNDIPAPDTYQHLSASIPLDAIRFFEQLLPYLSSGNNEYSQLWNVLDKSAFARHKQIVSQSPFSDLTIMEFIFSHIAKEVTIHLGNSTPVRYAQLFDHPAQRRFYSNRGTSGIDGSMSTAAGFAYAARNLQLLIIGDLSFFYDSNALWSKHLPPNLRIVMINNQGGGIFRFIDGPAETGLLEPYFEASHQTHARGIAQTHHIRYYEADDFASLEAVWNKFIAPQESVAILEVHSPARISGEVLHAYFDALANDNDSG